MKIAVTSVSGQLGAAIAKQLIEEIGGSNVIGIARTPSRAKHLGIEIREGDYDNREHFNEALKGVDAVLLVSGMAEPSKRIQQHRNVIEAAKQNGVKKIVYTSIVGDEKTTAFNPIVNSNRHTEKDIQASGLEWVIGRNGIYIEPDIEYLEHYIKAGEISNCAGEGICTYTSRKELAHAYSNMLLNSKHNYKVYNLVGEPITQTDLANLINEVYDTDLIFTALSVSEYEDERKAALGEFLGTIIAGIYEGIKIGAYDIDSDFEEVTGRSHKSALEMIKELNK